MDHPLQTVARESPSRPAPAPPGPAEDELSLERLSSLDDTDGLPALWLRTLCLRVSGCRRALLLLGTPGSGAFHVAASWPEECDVGPMFGIAEEAISKRGGLVETLTEPVGPSAHGSELTTRFARSRVAEPVLLAGEAQGAAVLEVDLVGDAALDELRAELHFGFGWLDSWVQRRRAERERLRKGQLETVLALVAASLEKERFQGAVTSFATELASELRCDRVSVGFLRKGRTRVAAMSHSATFGGRTNLIAATEAAMDEALDQEATVVYPAPDQLVPRSSPCHAELARQFGATAIATIPLTRSGEPCGAVTLEREEPFDLTSLTLLEVVGALAGPVLEDRRREDRFIAAKVADSSRDFLGRIVGPEHVVLKLIVGAVAAAAIFLLVARGEFRVAADAEVEPAVRRAAVAPFDGFILSAPARAGDTVSEGQLLGTLDPRDLRLEHAKWESELGQAAKLHRAAMADHDAPTIEIQASAMAEARAELERVEVRLAQTEIRAPFDGVVVAGDLTQRLGSPVQQGETLFEVAPLEAYRVRLDVDEKDIAYVRVGQEGTLVLAALPEESFPFEVTKITPVSKAEEGRNTFRVEAQLSDAPERLRPGIGGVGKIETGPQRWAWIWGRDVVDWVRLKLWAWTP